MEAAGEGNPAGLHTGVGVRTQKVDVSGPVLVAPYSTALELQTGNCGYSLPVGQLTILSHLLLDEVDGVLQVSVFPVANNRLYHQLLRPLHHLNDSVVTSSPAQVDIISPWQP